MMELNCCNTKLDLKNCGKKGILKLVRDRGKILKDYTFQDVRNNSNI